PSTSVTRFGPLLGLLPPAWASLAVDAPLPGAAPPLGAVPPLGRGCAGAQATASSSAATSRRAAPRAIALLKARIASCLHCRGWPQGVSPQLASHVSRG